MKLNSREELLSVTAEEAINDFLYQRDKILQLSKKDVIRSVAFYAAFSKLSDEFVKAVREHEFPTMSEKFWGYAVVYDYTEIRLQLEKYDEICILEENTEVKTYTCIEKFNMLKVEAKLLSVDEYAKLYNVDPRTVGQWIRRGKIRTAKKIGNSWMIPEVTDSPSRGYTAATYYLAQDIRPLSDEYKFLIGIEHLTIMQEQDDKIKYTIYCYKKSDVYPSHVQRYEQKEKEKFELALIAHPAVKYVMDFNETILPDLLRAY